MSPGPGDLSPGSHLEPVELLEDHVAVVAGVVVETRPGRAPSVACRLEDVAGLEIIGGDGDRRLAGVWSAASARELERLVRELVRAEEDVLGVFPTFIGRADGDEGDARGGARDGALAAMDAEGGARSGEE